PPMLAAGYGCVEVIRDLHRRRTNNDSHALRIHAQSVPPGYAALLAIPCLLAAGASLVSARAPAGAGDALCYHLELPKVFLARGSIEYLPLHENSTFPLLA